MVAKAGREWAPASQGMGSQRDLIEADRETPSEELPTSSRRDSVTRWGIRGATRWRSARAAALAWDGSGARFPVSGAAAWLRGAEPQPRSAHGLRVPRFRDDFGKCWRHGSSAPATGSSQARPRGSRGCQADARDQMPEQIYLLVQPGGCAALARRLSTAAGREARRKRQPGYACSGQAGGFRYHPPRLPPHSDRVFVKQRICAPSPKIFERFY